MIQHYPGCTAIYPERSAPEEKPPRATTDIPLDDGTAARVCDDCGAFEIVPMNERGTPNEDGND